MDKFECLSVFIRVAQLGTFTAAANELNTTQSAVSKKIAWLEKKVGFTLFHRHPRAISLTNSGQQYLNLALKITEEVGVTESQLRQEQVAVSGTLRLSVPSAFSLKLLAEPLNQFLNEHPDLKVDISVSDKFVNLLENDIDIAIRAAYLKDSGLKAKWLFDNELAYFASPRYLSANPQIEKAEDLIAHQCLTYSLMSPSNLWRFDDGQEVIKVKVNEQVRSDSPEMIVKMATLGQGVAAMPKWMIDNEIRSGELQLLLQQYQPMKIPMYLVFKDSAYQPKRIRAFIDYLVAVFDNNRAVRA